MRASTWSAGTSILAPNSYTKPISCLMSTPMENVMIPSERPKAESHSIQRHLGSRAIRVLMSLRPKLRTLLLFQLTGLGALALLGVGCNDQQSSSSNARRTASTSTSPHTVKVESLPSAAAISPDGLHRPEFLRIAEHLENSSNPFLGRRQLRELEQKLIAQSHSPLDQVNLQMQLCWHLLRVGETTRAAEHIEQAFSTATLSGFKGRLLPEIHTMRGLTYLRLAEETNCIQRHNRECCIFPLRNGGVHSDTTAARKAADSLLELLKTHGDDLSLVWLVNVVAMALGDHPQLVPEPYRIAPAAFESDYEIGCFVDVAPALGVDLLNLCGGVIVEDFDNDGYLDIVTSTYDPRGSLTFFRNLGDGRFEDASADSGLDDQLGGLNCNAADFDNDGDVDILVLRGAWLLDAGRIRNSLLQNNGDGTFTDVTRQVGLAAPACPTQAAVWGDFDNDGNLDLYVGNESRMEWTQDGDYPSQLFHSNGDGTFTDIASRAGVENDRYCKGVACGDIDDDGDLDLYLSNVGANRLYRNDGDGRFVDVAEQLKLIEPVGRSFATWFFDYDNNGRLDLFVAAYESNTADIAADYLGRQHHGTPPCLYRNDGTGRFTNVASQIGLDHPYLPMGAGFGDLDNDGYLDIYLATGDPSYKTLVPNIMLRNDGGRRFQDVTTSGGFGHLQKGHGVAFCDIDNDGDQDIYNQLGGFYPGDRFHNVLFRNPGHGNYFLAVRLVGRNSNRAGFGARIRVQVQTPSGRREFHRAVGSVSSFGGAPFHQHIGLGKAHAIERLEIRWPGASADQVFTNVPLNRLLVVIEGASRFETLPLVAIKLGD